MAYLYVRRSGRAEIREARSTGRGPRSITLASFHGPLTAELLDRAEAAEQRPFDRDALVRRAAARGIDVARPGAEGPAHELVARLRRGAALDPQLASVLRARLAERESAPLPEELAEVVEWIGASEHERGRALRDVLRLYDTIARSRGPVREPAARRFPRFEVREAREAS